MKKFSLTDLLIFVVSAELIGALSALFAGDFSVFYSEIVQPPLSPPAIVFPVVWAILYPQNIQLTACRKFPVEYCFFPVSYAESFSCTCSYTADTRRSYDDSVL